MNTNTPNTEAATTANNDFSATLTAANIIYNSLVEDGLGGEEATQATNYIIAAIRADERAKVLAEQAALMEKVKPLLQTIANAKRDVYGSMPTLWVFDDAQETAREVLAAVDATRGGGAVMHISQRDFDFLVDTIENPPEPTQLLRDLMKMQAREKREGGDK